MVSCKAVATGPVPALSRGPGSSVQAAPRPWLSRTETSFEPALATTTSGSASPLRSASEKPVGLVPAAKPLPPLSAGPNWPPPMPG